jgi:hypothetical protein
MNARVLKVALSVIIVLVVGSSTAAQYSNPWFTSYQIQNIGSESADIHVDYYDEAGALQDTAGQDYFGVPAGGSVVVVQKTDDPDLGEGKFSAVIRANQPIAAIANQQLVSASEEGFDPIAPYSSYSAGEKGAETVILPVIMHNWFGYYTEIFIQNVGREDAEDVDISYYPTTIDELTTGAVGQMDNDNAISRFATLTKNQQDMTELGAPQIISGSLLIDGPWTGRFLGAAVIQSDQPVVVVVNQHKPQDAKLFTYKGFSSGSKRIGAPIYMRGHFGYYASLTIGNVSLTDTANITITYHSDNEYSMPERHQDQSVVVNHLIPPGESINRYDGPPAGDDQSDLDDDIAFTQFFGTVMIESDQPIVAIVNQEAVKPGAAQAGTYSAMDIYRATTKVSIPLIQSDFYGYYTSLTIQSTTGVDGYVYITYTSDEIYSTVKNVSKTYKHSVSGAAPLNIYEGTKGEIQIGDINQDPVTWGGPNSGFIGSAIITATVPVVAFVNEESDVLDVDTMYSFNAFSLPTEN